VIAVALTRVVAWVVMLVLASALMVPVLRMPPALQVAKSPLPRQV
jgi:hypothetical protein